MASNLQVSVIIPVWNNEATLARAIDSALGQSFDREFEVVVVNDGSTDGTAEVMRRYGDRIVAVHRAHAGLAASRNAGVRESRGEYLAFLDSDDEWMPEKLARVVPALDDARECVLAYHDATEVDSCGRVTRLSSFHEKYSPPSFEELLTPEGHVPILLGSTVVMRRTTFDQCGGFNEQLPACEDRYLSILARERGPFLFLPEPLARRRFGPDAAREQWYIDGSQALNRALRERYGTRFRGDFLFPILRWSAWAAYCRDDRRTAVLRYLSALRRNPLRPKTYLFLVWVSIPRRVSCALGRLMPGKIRQKIVEVSAVEK